MGKTVTIPLGEYNDLVKFKKHVENNYSVITPAYPNTYDVLESYGLTSEFTEKYYTESEVIRNLDKEREEAKTRVSILEETIEKLEAAFEMEIWYMSFKEWRNRKKYRFNKEKWNIFNGLLRRKA
jgi:acyl carrier protein phosphodiesterase